MEDFLKDPFEETPGRYNSDSYRSPGASDSAGNFSELQFTLSQGQSPNPDGSSSFDYSQNPQSQPLQMQPQHQPLDAVINDPLLDTFDFLGSPTSQAKSPSIGPMDVNPADFGVADPSYNDLSVFNSANMDPLNNLDSIISPENNPANMFTSAQYLSPKAHGVNFTSLNSIAEDQLPKSFRYNNSAFSPGHSRHGSVSVYPPSNPGSYLSPQKFLSPAFNPHEGPYDTLKSPPSNSYMKSPPSNSYMKSPPVNSYMKSPPSNSYMKSPPSNSYMNSPPPMHLNTPMAHTFKPGPSIPMGHSQPSYGLGVSAPTASTSGSMRDTLDQNANTKHLTQEEKAKRRREFHNAVERRRRDLIKEKIKALGILVPPSLLTPQTCAIQALSKSPSSESKEVKELLASVKLKETKPNKATILSNSVDYLKHLQYVAARQAKRRSELEARIAELSGDGRHTATTSPSISSGSAKQTRKEQASIGEFDPDAFFSEVIVDPSQLDPERQYR